ncbi:hypothetical protein MTR_0014s0150 [Medicago truncatula]|uniref:Uncharacterized protein n=1 Tax=Medicago truncatula TaxID=3880 RepID=A0A072TJ45_MEDTR|nr:hypothetical protein MTR_0014s0150 [Medicago truncatula]
MAFPTTKESLHYSFDDETVPNIIAEFSSKFELAKLMLVNLKSSFSALGFQYCRLLLDFNAVDVLHSAMHNTSL